MAVVSLLAIANSCVRQMGMYTDPLQMLGRLNGEMLRAARLVVETGLHVFKWTRAKATQWMAHHTLLTDFEVWFFGRKAALVT